MPFAHDRSPQSERYGDGFSRPLTLSVDVLQERVKHHRPAETPEMFQRIFQGSMPALASGAITKRNRFYSSYIATYILSRIFSSSAGRLTRWNSFGFLRQSHAAPRADSKLCRYRQRHGEHAFGKSAGMAGAAGEIGYYFLSASLLQQPVKTDRYQAQTVFL